VVHVVIPPHLYPHRTPPPLLPPFLLFLLLLRHRIAASACHRPRSPVEIALQFDPSNPPFPVSSSPFLKSPGRREPDRRPIQTSPGPAVHHIPFLSLKRIAVPGAVAGIGHNFPACERTEDFKASPREFSGERERGNKKDGEDGERACLRLGASRQVPGNQTGGQETESLGRKKERKNRE